MRSKIFQMVQAGLVLTALAALGCSHSGSSSSGTCSAGQINSSYGCLATCGDGVNYGVYNNQCVYIGSTASCQGTCAAGQVQTAYGCLPQATFCGGTTCQGNLNGQCVPGINGSYNNFPGGYPGSYPGGYSGYPPIYNGGFFHIPPNYPWYWYHGNHYM